MNYVFHFEAILDRWPEFLYGAWRTMELTLISSAIGFAIGLAGAVARSFGPLWLKRLVGAYVEVIRNTPLLVQLYFVFFSLPLMGLRLSSDQAAILALSIHLGAYATEIIRAGVDSIHRSQLEAGLSLAMTKRQVFQHVVLMPALARVWPALSSQFVLMLLASSICSFIAVPELSGTAAIIEQNTFRSFETYIVVTIIYLVLALTLKVGLNWLGRAIFPRVSSVDRLDAKAEAA